jgi:hypothetical protein
MSAASLMLAGGAFLSTAGPANAGTPQTTVCTSLNATENYLVASPVATGTVSGCHVQNPNALSQMVPAFMSGAWFQPSSGPTGSSQGSITWQTGHATSSVTFTVTNVVEPGQPGGVCGSAVTVYLTIAVTSGPFAGSNGTNIECVDASNISNLVITNYGPITI